MVSRYIVKQDNKEIQQIQSAFKNWGNMAVFDTLNRLYLASIKILKGMATHVGHFFYLSFK